MSTLQQTPHTISDNLEVERNDDNGRENISPKLLFPDDQKKIKCLPSPTDVTNIDEIETEQRRSESNSDKKTESKTTDTVDFEMYVKKAIDIYQSRMNAFFDTAKNKNPISMDDFEKAHDDAQDQEIFDLFDKENLDNDDAKICCDKLVERIEEMHECYKAVLEDRRQYKRLQISYEVAKKYEKRALNSYKQGMEQLFENLDLITQEELESYHFNLMNDVLKLLNDPQDIGSNKETDKDLQFEVKKQIEERYGIYLRWYKEFKDKVALKSSKEEEFWAREIELKVKEEQAAKAKYVMNKAVSIYKKDMEEAINDIAVDSEKVCESHRKLLNRAKKVLETEMEHVNIDAYMKEMMMQIEHHFEYISSIANERIVRENEKRAEKQYVSSMDKVMTKDPYKPLTMKDMNDNHNRVMANILRYYNETKEYGIVQNSKRDLMVRINDHFKRYVTLNEERRHMKTIAVKDGNLQQAQGFIQNLNIRDLNIRDFNFQDINLRYLKRPSVIVSILAFAIIGIIYQTRLNAAESFKAHKAIDYSVRMYKKGMDNLIHAQTKNISNVDLLSCHEELFMDALDLFDNLTVDFGLHSARKMQGNRDILISSILKSYESYENLNNEKTRAFEAENQKSDKDSNKEDWRMKIAKKTYKINANMLVAVGGPVTVLSTVVALFYGLRD